MKTKNLPGNHHQEGEENLKKSKKNVNIISKLYGNKQMKFKSYHLMNAICMHKKEKINSKLSWVRWGRDFSEEIFRKKKIVLISNTIFNLQSSLLVYWLHAGAFIQTNTHTHNAYRNKNIGYRTGEIGGWLDGTKTSQETSRHILQSFIVMDEHMCVCVVIKM